MTNSSELSKLPQARMYLKAAQWGFNELLAKRHNRRLPQNDVCAPDVQAIFCRRRNQPRRPRLTRPGFFPSEAGRGWG